MVPLNTSPLTVCRPSASSGGGGATAPESSVLERSSVHRTRKLGNSSLAFPVIRDTMSGTTEPVHQATWLLHNLGRGSRRLDKGQPGPSGGLVNEYADMVEHLWVFDHVGFFI